jgi:pimeloyl-ACP methyl ester carboxylesterase
VARGQRGWLGGEWRSALELNRLLADPVYYGVGVPRGDGRRVLVLPGLFANDVYLEPMRVWLRRLGYRPLRSGLLVNAGCPERLTRSVERDVRRQWEPGSEKLAIIGHSRGGILGWVLAARFQESISHLILLGAPVGAALVTPSPTARVDAPAAARVVTEANARARRLLDPDCDFPECGCDFPSDLRRGPSTRTRILSLRTPDDIVVRPDVCIVEGAENVEVGGTHSGLACNAEVYRAVAVALSHPPRACRV